MSADNVHGLIGTAMRKRETIYNFDDFVNLCEMSSKKIKTIPLVHQDFVGLTSGCRVRNSRNHGEIPQLMRFLRGEV